MRRVRTAAPALGMLLLLFWFLGGPASASPGGGTGGGSFGGGGFLAGGWFWIGLLFFFLLTGLWGSFKVKRARVRRRRREDQVEVAAEEAAMDDAAFRPEAVRAATIALHKVIVEAWTARDRKALSKLVGPDIMVEDARRRRRRSPTAER